MNGKPKMFTGVMLAAALVWPSLGLAFDLPYFFADPLWTNPEVVEKGVVLPGDATPIPCAERKDFSQPLALVEAVDLALCNNPQIKSAWADIKIQAGALGEARAAYLPVLSGSFSRTNDQIRYSDSRYPSSNINRNTAQASATWRIFDFGGRSANHLAAENLLAAALANHNATLQRALTAVIQSYFDAMTANAALRAKTENEELAKNILKSAKVREEKGAISQTDTLRALTAMARASLERNRAQGDYQKSVAILKQLLGLSGNPSISLPQDLDGQQGRVESRELSRWLEKAQESHPAIIAARNQLEAAQKRVVVARSAGLPTLNFSGNYYQNTRPGEAVTSVEAKETTLALMLSIPIFDGFSSTYKLQGAQAQVEQKEAALADVELQIALELIKCHADATSALGNLEASAVLLEAAQSALTVSRRKYDKGAADISEVLSTQSALVDARQERLRCLSEWNSARLRLLASAGQLGRLAVAN